MNKKQAFLTFIFLFMQTLVWAVPVDFYDTLTSSGDSNMIKMTTDLFFNQFHSLEGYTVVEHDNLLLICKRGDASIRKYVNDVGVEAGEEFE